MAYVPGIITGLLLQRTSLRREVVGFKFNQRLSLLMTSVLEPEQWSSYDCLSALSMPSSTFKRQLSTSKAPCVQRGFQSFLKTSPPKAAVLTQDNFKRWKESGYDVKVAEKMLEDAFAARLKKLQQFKTRHLQGQLIQMIEGAVSLTELRSIVEVTSQYMGPQALVRAMHKTSCLPVEIGSDGVQPIYNPHATQTVMDMLTSHLGGSCRLLSTAQLATTLSSFSRAKYQPHAATIVLLKAQLDGVVGCQKVDSVGALMLACSKLSWGSAKVWKHLRISARAQLRYMKPPEVCKTLRAACWAASFPATSDGMLRSGSEFWAHAEKMVMMRMQKFSHAELSQVLLSLAYIGAPHGAALRQKVEEQLSAGAWAAVPPDAIIGFARAASCGLSRSPSHSYDSGEEAVLSSFLQQCCHAATHLVTHMDSMQLLRLLTAVHEAYCRSGRIHLGDVPRVVTTLLGLVSDVLRIRGFGQRQAGALPAPAWASSRQESHEDTSNQACKVLLLMHQLGHFKAPKGGGDLMSKRGSAALLQSMLEPARKLLEKRQLGAEAAAALLVVYEGAKDMVPSSNVLQLAEQSAAVLEAGAMTLNMEVAVDALCAVISLNPGGSVEKLNKACAALADTITASGKSKWERLGDGKRKALKALITSSIPMCLQSHDIVHQVARF
ncbi:hypothetical protein CEUSTIGMA_g5447.t1 [Chlamydomonas eustigma]|uniref:Uncharacterized protein n=1 Tax=Chlamydomonas eustigma TaxID=1157962 RepID=A0A250X4K8_9CHLO|nr:hypothetical protein CEUSTIGMA_g5447.t1 [Chlamydomonas eustigma]|eukprot:GAX78005.1 hypothetical protein CEUSTIGMA_g5447.t1 [Chlamydomonas eustigma]